MNRRDFLKLAGLSAAGSMLLPAAGCGSGGSDIGAGPSDFFKKPPNVLILMTDEQRAVQYWPAGWADANLPSLRRLLAHGLSFNHAFANACQCSPSRSTFLTSTYAPVNKVTTTPGTLNPALPNLAGIFSAAGYNVAYKGKWHLTEGYVLPLSASTPEEIAQAITNDEALQSTYGFPGWNSPDAGTKAGSSLVEMATLGGGAGGNDARYVSGSSAGSANIIEFLTQYDSDKPFCLIASLVNPHDIFVYPTTIGISGYDPASFSSLPIELPPTYGENLSAKPLVQAAFQAALNDIWPFTGGTEPVLYARFYAYLNMLADAQLMQILDALDAKGLTNNTLIIRIADHGELGLSHGGLRQKDYTAYEEMIRIPMIFSNPALFPKPMETNALAGLIDVLPTLASVAGIKHARERFGLVGRDLSPLFSHPRKSVQERVLFTYDDELFPNLVTGATHIRCIREQNWKYALYFDPAGQAPNEYEMYDLKNDPAESVNLAYGETPPAYRHQRERLQAELTATMNRTGTSPAQYVPAG